MNRLTLASTVLLIATFTAGCGRYYRARYAYVYAEPEPVPVAYVVERPAIQAPPPAPAPRPAPQARTIVVHAPPGSTVIVNPNGKAGQVIRVPARPPARVAPEPAEVPDTPSPVQPQEPEQPWFEGD